jgi:hypothetical protein
MEHRLSEGHVPLSIGCSPCAGVESSIAPPHHPTGGSVATKQARQANRTSERSPGLHPKMNQMQRQPHRWVASPGPQDDILA